MNEKYVENYLTESVKRIGGLCLKWVSPGRAGVPDRIVILRGGRVVFVELKAPGKKPSKLQNVMIGRLRALGSEVFVLDSPAKVDELIKYLKTGEVPNGL